MSAPAHPPPLHPLARTLRSHRGPVLSCPLYSPALPSLLSRPDPDGYHSESDNGSISDDDHGGRRFDDAQDDVAVGSSGSGAVASSSSSSSEGKHHGSSMMDDADAAPRSDGTERKSDSGGAAGAGAGAGSVRRNRTYGVHVQNLPMTATEDSIREAFYPYGELATVVIVRSKPGASKPHMFAFAHFATEEGRDRLLATEDVRVLGARVTCARSKDDGAGVADASAEARLFVGGLLSMYKAPELKAELQGFIDTAPAASAGAGDKPIIREVVVKGAFAFVVFDSLPLAKDALQAIAGKTLAVTGKPLLAEIAKSTAAVASAQAVSTLYVRNITAKSSVDSVKAAFAKFGPVKEVRFVTQSTPWYAFVEFEAAADAASALAAMNNSEFEGAVIRVEFKKKKDRPEAGAEGAAAGGSGAGAAGAGAAAAGDRDRRGGRGAGRDGAGRDGPGRDAGRDRRERSRERPRERSRERPRDRSRDRYDARDLRDRERGSDRDRGYDRDRERSDRERSDRERSDRERSDRERSDRERIDRERERGGGRGADREYERRRSRSRSRDRDYRGSSSSASLSSSSSRHDDRGQGYDDGSSGSAGRVITTSRGSNVPALSPSSASAYSGRPVGIADAIGSGEQKVMVFDPARQQLVSFTMAQIQLMQSELAKRGPAPAAAPAAAPLHHQHVPPQQQQPGYSAAPGYGPAPGYNGGGMISPPPPQQQQQQQAPMMGGHMYPPQPGPIASPQQQQQQQQGGGYSRGGDGGRRRSRSRSRDRGGRDYGGPTRDERDRRGPSGSGGPSGAQPAAPAGGGHYVNPSRR